MIMFKTLQTLLYSLAYDIQSKWLLELAYKLDQRPMLEHPLELALKTTGKTLDDVYIVNVTHKYMTNRIYKNVYVGIVCDKTSKRVICYDLLFSKDMVDLNDY